MKKKVIFFGTFFLLIFSFVLCTVTLAKPITQQGGSTPPFPLSAGKKYDALMVSGEVMIDVGEEYSFADKFMPYVTETEKMSLSIEVEDEEVLYLSNYKYKVTGLRPGISKVVLSSEDYYSELTITVTEKNLCIDGDFEAFTLGTAWEVTNQKNNDWCLYTGGSAVDPEKQIVQIVEDAGNQVVYFNHLKQVQSVLYKTYDVGPGQYYVKARIKGVDVTRETYLRVNQDNKNTVLTEKKSGTFEWASVETPVFRIEEGETKPLKIELYTPGNTGEMWFDDVQIYKVIEPDYLSISALNKTEDLLVGEEKELVCYTSPLSSVDYNYDYQVENENILEILPKGIIKGKTPGITKVTIRDYIFDYSTEVTVIVGERDGIEAKVNDNDNLVEVLEDKILRISVQTDCTNYRLLNYRDAQYGNYYIHNNQIVYSPLRDVYTLENNYDTFQVAVYEPDTYKYKIVDIRVNIKAVEDACISTDFWLTTPKDTALSWDKGSGDYSAGARYYDNKEPLYYGGGYIQITSSDVEILYPQVKRTEFQLTGNEYTARKNKVKAYNKIYATSNEGTLTLTTKNGGLVELILDGHIVEIQDRYYSSTGKIIHGVLFNYTPASNFYGYDTFELTLHNGETTSIVSATVYVLPGTEDFKFNELDLDGIYLLSNDTWLDEVRDGFENEDPYIVKWVNYYVENLKQWVPTGVPANGRSALEQFAILYQVTKNPLYAENCWKQMVEMVQDEAYSGSVVRRQSWGEANNGFLDAAMVTYSVAFAYNYIKDTLTPSQKEIVMKALYEEGFYYFETLKNVNVLLHGNNHCLLICGNLALAALSALSYEGDIEVTVGGMTKTINVQEMSAQVVITAFKFLQTGLVHYSESGGFPEGPAYSIYAHRNMISLLATLKNLYGETNGRINSFGLSDISGIMNYINYPLYTSSPNYESFYYGESEYSNNQPSLLWYTRIDDKNINAAILSKLADDNEQYNIMSLLWYTPGLFDRINLHSMEVLDYLLEDHELATFRSSFGDEMAIFTGLKGIDCASGSFAHKNLDSGTFEIYALGERFIGNFCNETYNDVVPDGFWDYDYQRWTYYKKNAQGQNTLVINPYKNPVLQQDPYASAPITEFKTNTAGGYAVVDLSNAYKASAVSAYRGLKFFDARTKIMIQDEFELREESTLYWSAHTEARIEIMSEKLARLTLNGKVLYAYIASDLGAFEVMPATALPGTIGEFCNLDNTGVNKLVIKLENIVSGTLSVVFIPTTEEITDFSGYTVTPLAEWGLETEVAKTDIAVEDIEIDALLGDRYKYVFNPYQYLYYVHLDKSVYEVPNLKVKYDESKYKVVIEKSNAFNNFTKVIVEDITTGEQVVYSYRFIVDTIITLDEGYTLIDVAKVTGNTGADNLIDGNRVTNFYSDKVETVIFEFEDITTITNALFRFNGGIIKKYYFDIYYSVDGVEWESLIFAGESHNNLGDEIYSLGFIEAKYIKVVFNGNNIDDIIDISKVEFYHNGQEPTVETVSNNALGIILGASIGGGVVLIGLIVTLIILLRRRKKE